MTVSKTLRKGAFALLALSIFLALAITFHFARPPITEAAGVSSWAGEGYGMLVDAKDHCIFGVSNTTAASAITSNCGEGTLFYRTDTATLYKLASGSMTAAPLTLGAIVSTGSITSAADNVTSAGVGTVSGTGVSVVENGNATVHKTVFTMAALSLTMTDVGGTSSTGAQKIYTFPEGVIQILGSSCNLTTLAGSGGIGDTAAVVESLGSVTVVNDNATLTTTEADIIASYAGTLSSGAGVFTKYGSMVTTAFDGHTTPIAVFLNVAVPDAGSSSSDTFALTGTCQITWANLGDF